MLAGVLLVLGCFAASVLGDTPANCLYEDIRGIWTFQETDRLGDNSINCDQLGPIVYTKTFTLSFPNTATDELGNEGTWTLISNQGFEVNINERSYFAFSYYEGDSISVTSYCDRTFNGWSRDKTVRNWSCFNGRKNSKTTTRSTQNLRKALPKRLYKNDRKMIEDINNSQSSWYTLEEMQRRAGSFSSPLPKTKPATAEERARVVSLPKNFDWRDVEGENYISGVRNQESCGCCYAFTSAAMLEARVRIVTRNQRQDVFSTQDIVSCSVLSQGCTGGFNYLVAGRYAQDQGLVAEECNTFIGQDASCTTDTSCSRTYVSDYSYIGGYYGACNEERLLQALVGNGPLAVAYMIYDDFFNYDGGIYHHTGFKNDFNPLEAMNHAVLLVGYGVEPTTGEKFWIVKNSWGADWGEQGYFRIRRSTNECSIESAGSEATVIP